MVMAMVVVAVSVMAMGYDKNKETMEVVMDAADGD